MPEDRYVWGGALAGLLVIALLGVLLFQGGSRIRAAIEPYIGDQPARWALYAVWFVFVYSTLSAIGGVVTTLSAFDPAHNPPTVVSFGYGAVFISVLSFLNTLVSAGHLIALIVVAVLLYRHLRERSA